MPYFKPCRSCGANLDPGERCDCKGSLEVIEVHSHPQTGTSMLTAEEEKLLFVTKEAAPKIQEIKVTILASGQLSLF